MNREVDDGGRLERSPEEQEALAKIGAYMFGAVREVAAELAKELQEEELPGRIDATLSSDRPGEALGILRAIDPSTVERVIEHTAKLRQESRRPDARERSHRRVQALLRSRRP